MEPDFRDFFADLRRTAESSRFFVAFSEAGKILSVGDGIVQVGGLRDAKLNELTAHLCSYHSALSALLLGNSPALRRASRGINAYGR